MEWKTGGREGWKSGLRWTEGEMQWGEMVGGVWGEVRVGWSCG